MVIAASDRLIMSSIHLERRESWESQLKRASALGFRGLEVFGHDLVAGNLTGSSAPIGLRSTADRLGLALTAHPWFDWTRGGIRRPPAGARARHG